MCLTSICDLSASDKDGRTALQRAKQKNYTNIIELLQKGCAKVPKFILVCGNCGARWRSTSRMAKHLGIDNITAMGDKDHCPQCGKSVD